MQNWHESPQNRRECLLSPNLKSDIIVSEYDGAYFRRASGIFTDRDGLND